MEKKVSTEKKQKKTEPYLIERLGLEQKAIELRKDGFPIGVIAADLQQTDARITPSLVTQFFQRSDRAVSEISQHFSQISKEIVEMEHDLVADLTALVRKLLSRCAPDEHGRVNTKDLTQLSNAVSRLAETIGKFQGKIGRSGNQTINIKNTLVENKQLIYNEVTKTLLDLEKIGKIKFTDQAYRESLVQIRTGKKQVSPPKNQPIRIALPPPSGNSGEKPTPKKEEK
jgi:hypothetical protein